MLLRPLLGALTVALALTLPAAGGELKIGAKAVLELFTSQGCNSCPKADALLEEMADHPDIVALAYHVDYWDYIGWEDTFGATEFSDYQRDYAQAWGSSRIFTPQLVINGNGGIVGSKREAISTALTSAALPLRVTLVEHGNDMLKVDVPARAGVNPAVVWLVTFIDRAEVAIERGENEGKKIAYTQIVTGRQVLGMWEPATGAELKLPLSEVLDGRSNGAVILVQEERQGLPGPILGAASFTRP